MNEYAVIFLAGLAGSLHCIGMCGGFACALCRNNANSVARQLFYNLGRIVTYVFIGAIVGQLGLMLIGHGGEDGWASHAQRLLAVTSGVLMMVVGLQFFGLRLRSRYLPEAMGVMLAQSMRSVVAAPGVRAPLALGVFNGFLPCPLIYAFAAQAAGSGGALPGALVMLAFGLGTVPALLATGLIGRRLRPPAAWRITGVQMAGVFIVVLGLITFARGLWPMGNHLHGA